MKYLSFLAAALSLTMLALLVVIGIKLDVLIADIMQVYMIALIVAFVSFIVALVMVIRNTRNDKSLNDGNDKGKKSGYAPSSLNS
jgi:hypothetical protein